jgi:hypothetical protein
MTHDWPWPWPQSPPPRKRCPLCGFHMPTQGHRGGCPDAEHTVANAAYREGCCKTCHTSRYRPGGTECEQCYRERGGRVLPALRTKYPSNPVFTNII